MRRMFGRARRGKKAQSSGNDGLGGEPALASMLSGDNPPIPYLSLLAPSEVEQFGRLPREAIVGEFLHPPAAGRPLDPATLRINARFVHFVHVVIARWAPKSPEFASAAERQRDGWIYVLDARTPTPEGRVPPEDILGAFEVRDGVVVADSYQPFPEHMVFTERGVVQLTPFLRERFVLELNQLPAD